MTSSKLVVNLNMFIKKRLRVLKFIKGEWRFYGDSIFKFIFLENYEINELRVLVEQREESNFELIIPLEN